MDKVTFGDLAAFDKLLKGLQPETFQVAICLDGALLDKRDEIALALAQAEVTEGTITEEARVAELKGELEAAEAAILEASTVVETRAPSEDELTGIQNLFEEDTAEWVLNIVALSLGVPLSEAKNLRKRLSRGSWTQLGTTLISNATTRSSVTPDFS